MSKKHHEVSKPVASVPATPSTARNVAPTSLVASVRPELGNPPSPAQTTRDVNVGQATRFEEAPNPNPLDVIPGDDNPPPQNNVTAPTEPPVPKDRDELESDGSGEALVEAEKAKSKETDVPADIGDAGEGASNAGPAAPGERVEQAEARVGDVVKDFLTRVGKSVDDAKGGLEELKTKLRPILASNLDRAADGDPVAVENLNYVRDIAIARAARIAEELAGKVREDFAGRVVDAVVSVLPEGVRAAVRVVGGLITFTGSATTSSTDGTRVASR